MYNKNITKQYQN